MWRPIKQKPKTGFYQIKGVEDAARVLLYLTDGNKQAARDAITRGGKEQISKQTKLKLENRLLLFEAYKLRQILRSDDAALKQLAAKLCKQADDPDEAAENAENMVRRLRYYLRGATLKQFVKRQPRKVRELFGVLR